MPPEVPSSADEKQDTGATYSKEQVALRSQLQKLMAETKIANTIPPVNHKVRESLLSLWGFRLVDVLNRALTFFSLKKGNAFWGIVYDSVSKQPLDPVIVKLSYADGREVATGVTDLAGRYGFLARPGKFKIFVRKTNYAFPSQYVTSSYDGIYEHVYHGEFFLLANESEVVAPNIPMDPIGQDWNQQAKQGVEMAYPYWKLLVKRLIQTLFWAGLIFSLLAVWAYYPNVPVAVYWVLAIYLLLIILSVALPDSRLWGQVVALTDLVDSAGLFLELHNHKFISISFGKTTADKGGKFLLRANKGRYLLTVSKINLRGEKVLLGSVRVSIGLNGVLNSNITIDKPH